MIDMENIPLSIKMLSRLFPLRFFFAKFTKLPLIGNLMDKMFFENDKIFYVPRDRVIQINQNINQDDSVLLPSEILNYFIDKSKHHVIMNFCICRKSKNCENYPQDFGCLFLGEAALNIDPKLGRKVTKEEAKDYVLKCREAGLVHLIGRNKLDSVWLNAKPPEKLLTICNCCECCCLWMMLPNLSTDIGSKVTKLTDLEIKVTDRCTGCGECIELCFVKAIKIFNKVAQINSNCRGCGRCVERCRFNAIEIILEKGSLEDSIIKISKSIDLT
ncbi:MAG: formylmethanofuran dehydrogenase FwdH [Candidatus Methanofastidiosum methylothiophilum]|uniref:Formylmethanofuran dehydrogenase FwdH n=1 Tax=Candidatus Methanofastidiosum methylothiophilum TaxID=1705564 RepID=A0A150ITC3_9EURY|nr:MAG: formylmethanofuran dehydrogenase FwdH [Candidatus Methanofastidiosum methylthiophilus]KYC48125.1 MAG: formylmethanofuran dehydrogenase FwdH [Candidatus Methanofastidiosum methylthiophilus]KYC50636.1 MAG: formylmethanofuran dehydrogenase FwdH [Candidatus Methanofastidiosum methylthiophilus]